MLMNPNHSHIDSYANLVSIITPAFNSGRFIAETIQSVQNQSYQSWEMIIVDDCSDDSTEEIVHSFKKNDDRIKYFRNSSTKGAAFSRNLAVGMAKGKWIAFLDSDDLWHPHKLEKQLDFMLKNNYHFSYTEYSEINDKSEEIGRLISGPKVISKNMMLAFCWPGCLTVMYDAHLMRHIEFPDIKINEDYAFWIKISEKTNCYLLDENLAKYRRHQSSLSNLPYIRLIKWHYLMFRKALDKNILSSIMLTFVNIIFGTYKKIFFKKNIKSL